MVENRLEDLKKIYNLEDKHKGGYASLLHLMPPVGWLNDPNGLCELGGVKHIFFQYAPYDPKGGDKYWGHYETTDYVNYTYTGIVMSPDCEADRDGVFSGSALTETGKMFLYYTGNIEDSRFDGILEGRESNTILVESSDGHTVGNKKTVLGTNDYPKELSLHVRDPKVWKENGCYYMVLGARTRDDIGCVMLWKSQDKISWQFCGYVESNEKFGFMWECPDMFELGGRRFLSCSPQGVDAKEFEFQNLFQSGYFTDKSITDGFDELKSDNRNTLKVNTDTFIEWDMGFDFYAPQTFMDESGRRVIIGWMGMGDDTYGHDPCINNGWQHMLTFPRTLTLSPDGVRIRQWPVHELENLRTELVLLKNLKPLSENEAKIPVQSSQSNEMTNTVNITERACQKNACENTFSVPVIYDLMVENIYDSNLKITFDDALTFSCEKNDDAIVKLSFSESGYGRSERRIKISDNEGVKNVRVIVDSNCLEIYINDGDYVMSTKLYPEDVDIMSTTNRKDLSDIMSTDLNDCRKLNIKGYFEKAYYYKMKPISIRYNREC